MQLDSTSLELRKSHCRPSAIPPGHLRVTWREAKRGVVKRTRLAVQQTELVLPVDHIAAAVTTWQRSAAPDGKGDLPASPQQILDDLAARLPRTNHQNTPRRELPTCAEIATPNATPGASAIKADAKATST